MEETEKRAEHPIQESFSSKLQCIQCESTYSIDQVLYLCPSCGGLLDVVQDISSLKQYTATQWKSLIQARKANFSWPFPSGVWLHKEWVHPEIPFSNEHIVSLGEGNTPLISLPRFKEELGLDSLWVKQCGVSHTGSFKDLGMTVLVSHVKFLLSKNHPIRAIACASTGDTSAALAAYAAYANIPVVVFLPQGKISTAQLIQPLACQALVLSLRTDFDGCMSLVKEISKEENIYLANSMNPLRLEGQKTAGIEVIEQLNWQAPDWFIIPSGNLGNVSALVKGMRLLFELGIIDKIPRVCAAQSANANPLYLSFKDGFKKYQPVEAKKTLASAIQIGHPISYPRAKAALLEVDGVVEQANDEELANASARCDCYGMFNDPHTGVALACLEKLRKKGVIEKTAKVVVMSTAHGLKFSDTKQAYHDKKLPIHAKYNNTPIELEANKESILQVLKNNFHSQNASTS